MLRLCTGRACASLPPAPTSAPASTRWVWRWASISNAGSARATTLAIQAQRPRCRANLHRSRQPDLADGAGRGGERAHADFAHRIAIANEIPLGKGLGSSAAALTAGVVIADRLLGLGWKPLRILDEAARLEGHPDNVAACVLGSIVASAIDEGGVARAVRVGTAAALRHRHRGARFRPAHHQSARSAAHLLHARGRHLQRAARRPADRRARHRHHHRVSHGARRPLSSAVPGRTGAGAGRHSKTARARACWDAR